MSVIISAKVNVVNIGGDYVIAFSVCPCVCKWWLIMQWRLRDVIIAMTPFYSASSNAGIYHYYFSFPISCREVALQCGSVV